MANLVKKSASETHKLDDTEVTEIKSISDFRRGNLLFLAIN